MLKYHSVFVCMIMISSVTLIFLMCRSNITTTPFVIQKQFEFYLREGDPIVLDAAQFDFVNPATLENLSTTKVPNLLSNHLTCNMPKLTPGTKDIYELDYEQFLNFDTGVNRSCINNNSTIFAIDFESNLVRSKELAVSLKDAHCYCKSFWKDVHKPDFHYVFEKQEHLISQQQDKIKLPPQVENLYIWCSKSQPGSGSTKIYEEYVSQVSVKPGLENKLSNRPATQKPDNYPSVLIYGLDSSSHMNIRRYLPKVHDFLVNEMDAVEFQGFNSLGDGTRYSMFPFFSGLEFNELSNLFRKRVSNNSHFADVPLIWREFQKMGYRTSWAEDHPQDGIFNSGLYPGLYRYPVDYDFRIFTRLLERHSIQKYNKSLENEYGCYGSRFTFDVLLENLVKTAFTFSRINKPVWHFTWTSELTHEVNVLTKYQEPFLLEALGKMHRNNILNNTVLIFMSDHGMRHGPLRQRTKQGFLEERLPLLYIILPKGFKGKFPNAYANMKENANKLVTAFDLHATMKDLMKLETLESDARIESEGGTGRSISLFKHISANRSCELIGIPTIYCVCMSRTHISTEDSFIQQVASFIVKAMNMKLEEYPLCEQLQLDTITNSIRLGSAANSVFYEIGIGTSPGNGMFYASVFEDTINKAIKVTDVTRTSKYGRDADCVKDHDKWLKPFCYCKN